MVDSKQVQKTFLELVNINSPSKQERGVADYVKTRLAAMGFDVTEDDTGAKIGGDAGNVIAFKAGTAPGVRSIFLCCHMDTVEPTDKLKVIIEDGVIRTDGTTILGADDKAGITAVIEGIASIQADGKPHGDLQVLFDVSEEGGLFGAKHLDTSKIKGEFGFVLDTGGPVCATVVSAPSQESILVEIEGKAAHAGIEPEKGVSAIVAASKAIASMKLGRIDVETTANIGSISGGKARNIVADHCTVKAEARSRNEEKLVAQVEHMRRTFEQETAKMGAKAVFTSEREYTTFRFTESDEIVKLAMNAARRVGVEPVLQDGGGGSDANVFNAAGIQTLVLGVGYNGPHTPTENISIADLTKATEFAAALIEVAAER